MSVEEVGVGRGDIARRIATISDTTFVVGHGRLEQIHKYAVETVTQCRIPTKHLQNHPQSQKTVQIQQSSGTHDL